MSDEEFIRRIKIIEEQQAEAIRRAGYNARGLSPEEEKLRTDRAMDEAMRRSAEYEASRAADIAREAAGPFDDKFWSIIEAGMHRAWESKRPEAVYWGTNEKKRERYLP